MSRTTRSPTRLPFHTAPGSYDPVNEQQLRQAMDDRLNESERALGALGTMAQQDADDVAITGGSITGITDLAVADGGTGASTAADARFNLGIAIEVVTSIAALKALDTTRVTHAILTADGRAGRFIWKTGDYSSHITADANTGVYVKADAIAAASGAWVRDFDFVNYRSRWFGTTADHSTDNSSIINTIITVANLPNTNTTAGKQAAAYIHVEGGVRFASTSLDFLPSDDWVFVYLCYFANSDTTRGIADGGGASNEHVVLSVNSGYPGDATGGMVAEWRHGAPLHPAIMLDVMKHLDGADAHLGSGQVRIPDGTDPVRASVNLLDENVLRWRAVYEGYGDENVGTGVFLQPFCQTVSLANVGSSGWAGIPANGTVFWGVTSGARAYKTGHSAPSIQGVWISGTFVPGEQITDGVTTSANSISGGGVAYTLTANQFLGFGVNHAVLTYGLFPGHAVTGVALGARLSLAPSTSLGTNKETVTSPALLFTRDTGLPTTGKQIVLDSNARLINVDGVAQSTTPRGHVAAVTVHGRFTHAGLSPLTGSFNFSSVTNPATGQYDVVFSNALASANYTVIFGSQGKNFPTYDTRSTTGFTIYNFDAAGAALNALFELGFSVIGGDI